MNKKRTATAKGADMKIEEALEFANNALAFWKKWCETMDDDMEYASKIKEAARVLREGEKPVEVVEEDWWFVCPKCGPVSEVDAKLGCFFVCGKCKWTVYNEQIKRRKTYTTTRRLTTETVESEPVFEEIE